MVLAAFVAFLEARVLGEPLLALLIRENPKEQALFGESIEKLRPRIHKTIENNNIYIYVLFVVSLFTHLHVLINHLAVRDNRLWDTYNGASPQSPSQFQRPIATLVEFWLTTPA